MKGLRAFERGGADLLRRDALRLVAASCAVLALASCAGATVRVLPWLLEPRLPLAVTLPFARSLLLFACEASVVVGWPLGWCLAAARLVERGEARVLALLGESPSTTALRLVVQGLGLAALLASLALLGGRDASAPGRVVQELLDEGEAACARAPAREVHLVPLVGATWVCVPGERPRLVGRPPFAGALTFSAAAADVSPDLTAFRLRDARLAARGGEWTVSVRVRSLVLRGMAPFTRASGLPPWLRALVLAAAAWASAYLGVRGSLGARAPRYATLPAVVLGVVGPLLALFIVRQLETRAAPAPAFVLAPLLAACGSLATLRLLARLPREAPAGTR